MTAQTKSALFKIRKSFSKQIRQNHLLLGDGCCCYPCTEGVQAAVAGGVVWCGVVWCGVVWWCCWVVVLLGREEAVAELQVAPDGWSSMMVT